MRELRRAPVLEKKPLDVLSTAEGKGVREKRGSNSAHFKWPTDPLWSRQWSLVINSLIARDDVYYTHNSAVQCGSEWGQVWTGYKGAAGVDPGLHWQGSRSQHCGRW